VYADFSLPELKQKFQLTIAESQSLFHDVQPVEIPATLAGLLAENIPLALAIDTEKARSEFIIAPILSEYRKFLKHQVSIFSGVEFSVDVKQGLNGTCDFIISRSPEQFSISAPIVVLVEAKNNRIKDGIPQCVAEMVASALFNDQHGIAAESIHGVVTTGSLWRFLKLSGKHAWIDLDEYHIREVEKIFAILLAVST